MGVHHQYLLAPGVGDEGNGLGFGGNHRLNVAAPLRIGQPRPLRASLP
jgi:hypothetical protein